MATQRKDETELEFLHMQKLHLETELGFIKHKIKKLTGKGTKVKIDTVITDERFHRLEAKRYATK